jgi:23S rRNA pseudouridine1911/1915/1917 synthase
MDHYRPLGEGPRIVDETESYAVVYKPPLMFSAPLGGVLDATLLGWYARRCPAVLGLAGAREGGLLHRLDFETEGLVLLAKTQDAYQSLRAQQAAGDFVKEYLAMTGSFRGSPGGREPLPGFPPFPSGLLSPAGTPVPGACIESFFRPWGPGRRAVRPAVLGRGKKHRIAADQGQPYRTEILERGDLPWGTPEGGGVFRLRIFRGFRHQIRCHLAWMGAPILYDALYGGEDPAPRGGGEKNPIALRAWAFHFFDPGTGEQKSYRLPSF